MTPTVTQTEDTRDDETQNHTQEIMLQVLQLAVMTQEAFLAYTFHFFFSLSQSH